MTDIVPTRPRTIKYNPAFLEDDDLVRSFVVREIDHQLVLDTVRDNDTTPNTHVLVVGPRGSGKTTLVRRVTISIGRDPELAERWIPVIFAEESYRVVSVGELWLEALLHLAEQTDDPGLRASHAELNRESDDDRLRERSLAVLLDFADGEHKRLVLVVENLDMLTEQIRDDDAWKIRHTLQSEPRIMLLASATTRFEAIDSASKAFYELFRIHELPALDLDECHAVWTAASGHDVPREQVRPIQILTGGNLRLMTIISRFGAKHSFEALLADLMSLVDEHTEYFKSHLDGMASLERKVYLALAEIWAPATASEVAALARIDVHRTSALLGRLVGRRAVSVADSSGRKKQYQLTERLYNVYHLMRRRGSPSSRVKAAVSFMVGYYGPRQLAQFTTNLAQDARKPEKRYRAERIHAYEQILALPEIEPYRDQILRETPEGFFEDPEVPMSIKDRVRLMRGRRLVVISDEARKREFPRGDRDGTADLLLEFGFELTEDVVELCRVAVRIEPHQAGVWARLGFVLGNTEEGERSIREAIRLDPDYAWAWLKLGQLLGMKADRLQEAFHAVRKVIELEPDYAKGWIALGDLWCSSFGSNDYFEADQAPERFQRHNEAEAAYRKAIELAPSDDWAWARLGELLHDQLDRYNEAEDAYRKAIQFDQIHPRAWGCLGRLLHEKFDRYDEAEFAYRKAIEIDPADAWAWANLGQLLHEKLDRYAEAEFVYRKAIELDPFHDWAWGCLGRLLHEKLDRYDEAEFAYRKAIELDAADAWAWANLGQLLHEKLDRYDEAEFAYRKVIEFDPADAWAWSHLAQLLHQKLRRYDEAEVAYRKAIELEPIAPWEWAYLGQLLHQKLDRYDEAEVAYRKAIMLAPDAPWAGMWVQLGRLLHHQLGRYVEAEVAYHKAIEFAPTAPWAWTELGRLLHHQLGRYDEAEVAYRKVIEFNPSGAWAWAELGQLLHRQLRRYDEAEQAYRKAIELDPSKPKGWVELGQLLHQQLRRHDEAEQAYRKAIELAPNRAWTRVHLGQLLHLAHAHVWARAAVELVPTNSHAAHTLATISCALGRIEEALDAARIYVNQPDVVASTTVDAIALFTDLAARGAGQQALALLRASPSALLLEALITALELDLDSVVSAVPREVLEVAQDIQRDIQSRRASLTTQS